MLTSAILLHLTFWAFSLTVSLLLVSAGVASHSHDNERNLIREHARDGFHKTHFTDSEHNVEFDHEAIIGNVKEAQKFDTLSPEESKRRLAVLVQLMDTNNDGHVDRHELKAWILRSFKKLSEEEASDRFEELDQDGDDQVTWKEYILDVYSMEDEYGNYAVKDFDGTEEELKIFRNDKDLFDAADLNKDGMLNSEEFVFFQNPEEQPQMLPIVLNQTMRDKDINNDGKIDFKEYLGERKETQDKEWLITEKERFDKDFDVNGDGYLVGNEVLNWMIPSNEMVATDEVDHLFVSTDEDHDDRLSYAEIINNYEIFVGSEATDYGEHLKNNQHFPDEL